MGAIAAAWLDRLCAGVPGAERAVLLQVDSDPGGTTVGWPANQGVAPALENAARAAFHQRSVLAQERPAEPERPGRLDLAVPLVGGSGMLGAVAIEVADGKEADAAPLAGALRGAARWLEAMQSTSPATGAEPLLLDLLGIGLEQNRFEPAAMAIATELATRLGCERVSVGLNRGRDSRVVAISHSSELSGRSDLIRDLEQAMDEACDQDAVLVEPPIPGHRDRIARAHEALRRTHGAGAVCTVPFVGSGTESGALVFERSAGGRFGESDVTVCETAGALVGSLLLLRREAEAGPLPRAAALLREEWTRRVGPDSLRLKAAAAVLGPLLLLLAVVPGTYRVSCDATLEGRVQRAVVANLDGFVSEASARAGDLVREGQLLAQIDDRDLRLELRKWQGRREQLRRELREASAARDRPQASIIAARIAQADAQLALLDEDLARTSLQAPFDGVVIRGDLSQVLGSPVEKGQVLFEVAPLDGYRIILEVDERDVAEVEAGQGGRLALSALPGTELDLTVERVTPVATAADGTNHFRVEARLEHPTEALRPGMSGVAKVDVGERRILWIWTHRMLDWLRLRLWSLWP